LEFFLLLLGSFSWEDTYERLALQDIMGSSRSEKSKDPYSSRKKIMVEAGIEPNVTRTVVVS
jgi:hypothetical protein